MGGGVLACHAKVFTSVRYTTIENYFFGWRNTISVVGRLFARYFYKTQELYFNVLKSNVEHRLSHRRWSPDGQLPKDHPVREDLSMYGILIDLVQTDITQWVIDTSPKENPWTSERIVHEIMALWFASIHGLSIVWPHRVVFFAKYFEHRWPRRDCTDRYLCSVCLMPPTRGSRAIAGRTRKLRVSNIHRDGPRSSIARQLYQRIRTDVSSGLE